MFYRLISLLCFNKRDLGQGIERIHQSVKESLWFTELFLRLCFIFVPVTVHSKIWLLRRNCILQATAEMVKIKDHLFQLYYLCALLLMVTQ